jgi:hypothetical protein
MLHTIYSYPHTTYTIHHAPYTYAIRSCTIHRTLTPHSPGDFEGEKVLELDFGASKSVTSATLFTTNTESFGTNPKIYGSNDGTTWNELLDTCRQTSCNGGLSVKYLAGSPYPNDIYPPAVEVSSWTELRAACGTSGTIELSSSFVMGGYTGQCDFSGRELIVKCNGKTLDAGNSGRFFKSTSTEPGSALLELIGCTLQNGADSGACAPACHAYSNRMAGAISVDSGYPKIKSETAHFYAIGRTMGPRFLYGKST